MRSQVKATELDFRLDLEIFIDKETAVHTDLIKAVRCGLDNDKLQMIPENYKHIANELSHDSRHHHHHTEESLLRSFEQVTLGSMSFC